MLAAEVAIIISMSLYNPVLATYRVEHTPKDRIGRTLSAWSIGQQASIAMFTAFAGMLADITSRCAALTVMGLVILTSPMPLPGEGAAPVGDPEIATASSGPNNRSQAVRQQSRD